MSAGLPFGVAVIVLAVVLGGAGAARAENECGRPEAGTPIVCSPSNYDADTDGNIVYRPGEAHEGDFTVRLADDLSIRYDRDDPDDDRLVFPVSGAPPLQRREGRDGCGPCGRHLVSLFRRRDLERERSFGRP